MKKGGVVLIGMIVALVFIFVAFVGPWYSFEFMCLKAEAGLTTGAVEGLDRGPFDTAMYISIIAFITTILAIIGALGVAFNFGNPNTMGKVGGIFGILTFIFALIAPIYFMTHEGFATLGFWNDYGGPRYGWYLMLIATIIALISSIPLFKKQAA